ncbi:MAG: type I methionyl aminopeptidase [Verrucomicrobiales bacterium]
MPIYCGKQLDGMRAACALARDILLETVTEIQPGVTTGKVDEFAAELMCKSGCRSAFLGYQQKGGTAFPGNVCISVNDGIVHGIGGPRVIQPGDIIKLDVGIISDGWVGDNALTVPVGDVSPETQRLLQVTEESLHIAIGYAREGVMLGDLCASVDRHVREHGFSVVREFVGHGVGRKLHESPQVPNYRPATNRPRLRAGMILAIEPMVNLGVAGIKLLDDDWTVVTADGKVSAHFEHTVLITSEEPEILTWRERTMGVPVIE